MKKNKIDLEKQEKFLKAMAPGLLETVVFLVSLVLYAVGEDLKLEMLIKVSSSMLTVIVFYVLIWFCHLTVVAIIKHVRNKNKPKEEVKNEDK